MRERHATAHVGKWTHFADTPSAEGRAPSIVICTYGTAAAALLHPGGPTSKARARLIDWPSVSTLIVDETSQLWAGAALGVLCQVPNVRHWVFVGDQHQLPPYGYADVPGLSSLFDVAKAHADVPTVTLNDTYRLPHAVGRLISRVVYSGQLQVCERVIARARFIVHGNRSSAGTPGRI